MTKYTLVIRFRGGGMMFLNASNLDYLTELMVHRLTGNTRTMSSAHLRTN